MRFSQVDTRFSNTNLLISLMTNFVSRNCVRHSLRSRDVDAGTEPGQDAIRGTGRGKSFFFSWSTCLYSTLDSFLRLANLRRRIGSLWLHRRRSAGLVTAKAGQQAAQETFFSGVAVAVLLRVSRKAVLSFRSCSFLVESSSIPWFTGCHENLSKCNEI